jgi:hypothetical protein
VQQLEQTFGIPPGILVNEQKGANPDQQNKNTFGELERSDRPQEIFLGGVQVDFRGREHAARKERLRVPRLPHRF